MTKTKTHDIHTLRKLPLTELQTMFVELKGDPITPITLTCREIMVRRIAEALEAKKRAADPVYQTLLAIARKHLSLETLEERRSDSLDFREQAVWQVRAALEAAYQAGVDSTKRKRRRARKEG